MFFVPTARMIFAGLKSPHNKTYCGFLLLSLFGILKGVSSVLRCSQCVSGVNGQCMTTAPQPTPCESRVNGTGPVHCMIAIRTDKTGTLVTFSRGCTGVILPKSGCREQADNTTLCYLICSIDSCNSAEKFHSSFNFQLSYKNILIISLLFIFKFVVT